MIQSLHDGGAAILNVLSGEVKPCSMAGFEKLKFSAKGWASLEASDPEVKAKHVKEVLDTKVFQHAEKKYIKKGEEPVQWMHELWSKGTMKYPMVMFQGKAVKMAIKLITCPLEGSLAWWDLKPIQEP